jgi:hypothetical protein
MSLSSPRPAVVARERKGMAPPSSFLESCVLFRWSVAAMSCSFLRPALLVRGEGDWTRRRLNMPDGRTFCWWVGSTARGSSSEGTAGSSSSPSCPMV